MNAGDFDRLLLIQARVPKRGAAGGVAPQWDEFATVWAKKEDVSGSETRRGLQLVPQTNAVFTLRHWIDGLTTKHRIVLEDFVYDILTIREIGRREMAEIQAVSREQSLA